MTINEHYSFGELKSGDKFAFNGFEYQKLSGNYADLLDHEGKLVKVVDFSANPTVYLYEIG